MAARSRFLRRQVCSGDFLSSPLAGGGDTSARGDGGCGHREVTLVCGRRRRRRRAARRRRRRRRLSERARGPQTVVVVVAR